MDFKCCAVSNDRDLKEERKMFFQLTDIVHNRETLEIYQIDNNYRDFHDVNEINKPFHLTCTDHKRKYYYLYVWPKMNRSILLDFE
jgi:hypothetical protein